MKLAKPHVDLGLYTVERDAMPSFWQQEVGLVYQEMLPVGGGVQQHRYGMNGSVMKLNHSRGPLLDAAPSGSRELRITREGIDAPYARVDADGPNAYRCGDSLLRFVAGTDLALDATPRAASAT